MTNVLGRLAEVFALAGGLIVLLIVLVTTTNAGAFILDRIAGLFGADVSGLPGYEDFVRVAISCAALMFFPYCQARRGHVAVDLFLERFPRRVQRLFDRIWLVATALIAGFLAWWMTLGMFEKRDDSAITGVLGWPEWPFYAPGIAAVVLWGLVALSQIPGERTHV